MSYSLLCYINHLYKTKRGKNTTKLYDLFRVVGDLTQYCLHRSDMIPKWEKHPQQMLLCFFEDLYCGTVNNTCLYGLNWDGVSLTTMRKLINEFDHHSFHIHGPSIKNNLPLELSEQWYPWCKSGHLNYWENGESESWKNNNFSFRHFKTK